MDFDFTCPFCNEELSVAEEKEGVICKCPGCGNEIVPTKVSMTSSTEKEEAEARKEKERKEKEEEEIKRRRQAEKEEEIKRRRQAEKEEEIKRRRQAKNALTNSFYNTVPNVSENVLLSVLHILAFLHIIAAIVFLVFAIQQQNGIFLIGLFVEAMAAALTYGLLEFVERFYFLSHNSGRIVILLEEISRKLGGSIKK